jgi:hypothetical protein
MNCASYPYYSELCVVDESEMRTKLVELKKEDIRKKEIEVMEVS